MRRDCREPFSRPSFCRKSRDGMDDGVRSRGRGDASRKQFSAADRTALRSKIEHSGSEMFGGVDLPIQTEDLLGGGDSDVIKGGSAVMRKPGFEARSRSGGKNHTSGSAMQIQGQIGAEAPDRCKGRIENRGDIRITLKNSAEPR